MASQSSSSQLSDCLASILFCFTLEDHSILAVTDIRSVTMSGPENRSLRELLTGAQTEDQRREIYNSLTQPILQSVSQHLHSYFQQLYSVVPMQQDGEQVSELPFVSIACIDLSSPKFSHQA